MPAPKRKPKTLTDLGVKKIRPPATGRAEYWDAALPGFGLRVSASGTKTWCLMTRTCGRQRRFKLGRYPQLDLAAARDVARDYLTRIAKGEEPTAHRDQHPETFGAIAAEYIRRECPQLARGHESARRIERELLPHWENKPIAEITRREVVRAVDRVMDRGTPYAAIATQRLVKRILSWSISRGYIGVSPVAGMELPVDQRSRDRVLDDDEVGALWLAWGEMAWPFGTLMKLLLVTGQRRTEVATMGWSDIDLEGALWTLSREQTKSDRRHEVPLSPMVLEVFETIPRLGDGYVFLSGQSRTDRPISGYSKAKKRAAILSGVRDWRLHDLRRTAATGMARLGAPDIIVAAVLNHAPRGIMGVTSIYNRHEYLDEKRDALDRWAQHLRDVVTPPSANVVKLATS